MLRTAQAHAAEHVDLEEPPPFLVGNIHKRLWLEDAEAVHENVHEREPLEQRFCRRRHGEIARKGKLAALEAEARTAKALALKAAKVVETIEINDLEGITQAQTYRSNLWPSVSPSIKPALDAAQRGERLVVSEETKKYVERLKTRM